MNIVERMQAPTPGIFKMIRTVGLVLAGVGGAIVTAPVSLPAVMVAVGGYLAVAGAVMGAVSQITVEDPRPSKRGSTARKPAKQ